MEMAGFLRFGRVVMLWTALCGLHVGGVAQAQENAPSARPTPPSEIQFNRFLDAERPDPGRFEAMLASADKPVPPGLGRAERARFLEERARIRREIGMSMEAQADLEAALSAARQTNVPVFAMKIALAALLVENSGDRRRALELSREVERDADRPNSRGWLFAARLVVAANQVGLGDLAGAEQTLARSRALLREAQGWTPHFATWGANWTAQVEATAVSVAAAQQDHEAAEAAARRAELAYRRSATQASAAISASTRQNAITQADRMLLAQARMKILMGRLAEAEADARLAATSRIRNGGKFQNSVAEALGVLRMVRLQQARYADALALQARVFEILDALRTPKTSRRYVSALNDQAWIYGRMANRRAADETYVRVDEATAGWPSDVQELARNIQHRIIYMAATGRGERVLEPAQRAVERRIARFGADDVRVAEVGVVVADILARSGKINEGLAEFRRYLPILIDNRATDADDIDAGGTMGQLGALRIAVGNFLHAASLLPQPDQALIGEAFRYAEEARADSVQRALVAASARAAARDQRLAPLVRREQDAAKELTQAVRLHNAMLELPPGQRDAGQLAAARASISKLRDERRKILADLDRRFPQYGEMIAPQAPGLADIQARLQPGEAFLSIFSTPGATYIWAIPQSGTVEFARSSLGRPQVNQLVTAVRKGLDAGGATLFDIPAFDVGASFKLYEAVLKPVEPTILGANRLVVAASGALGGLPFGLLARAAPDLDTHAAPLFSAYRTVPWLIRTHAITMVPSAAAFRTLRQGNAGAPGRKPFIGFGDPVFSREAEEASPVTPPDSAAPAGENAPDHAPFAARGLRNAQISFRNLPVRLGLSPNGFSDLQRLPDTADELIAVARSLGANPDEAVRLRENANTRAVREANLAQYRVVAFATHGLVPGELPALRSPALALTAPDVAGVDGDGLLRMEDVLQLRLDADWVILSACNTAAGAGVGVASEAASGLGRAFFFAGSRSLLLTSWQVHSVSARELVVNLFEQHANGTEPERAGALKAAMNRMIDEGVMKDDEGRVLASYSHPVFWAPYILFGDGGRSK